MNSTFFSSAMPRFLSTLETFSFFASFGALMLVAPWAAALDIDVPIGGSIQEAIDRVAEAGGGTVNLAEGVYEVTEPIEIKSDVTLSGAGREATTITTSEVIGVIRQAGEGLKNITIQNLGVTGVPMDGANAIHLIAMKTDHRNIRLLNVHASETGWGVHIKGARNLVIKDCEFVRNGAPGKEGYAHNLYLRRVTNATITDSKLNESTTGNGCNISYSQNITLERCEMLDNFFRGVRAADTVGYTVKNCLIGRNGNVGLLANTEKTPTQGINFVNNVVFENGEGGIMARHGVTGRVTACRSFDNQKFDFDLNKNIKERNNRTQRGR